jgi:hypothetical protein
MDTPENYYAILGVPLDADDDTLKRAYRQLARLYHPDLAGPAGATQMKRINRAYDVLSDPEKRLNYDTIVGGSIDLRGGLRRPRPVARKWSQEEEAEFAGLSIFSTRGPLRAGAKLRSNLGIVSALHSVKLPQGGLCVVAGSLDGHALLWRVAGESLPLHFSPPEGYPIESLRSLRLSADGRLLAGWGRLGLHVWSTTDASLLWSYALEQRAVSAHYSLDMVFKEGPGTAATCWLALPLQLQDPLAPRARGVRGSDVVAHTLGGPAGALQAPVACVEDDLEKRRFWAIRLRALSQDLRVLCTLSCASVPDETEQMIVLRHWNLTSHTRLSAKPRPQLERNILGGLCADGAPPYAVTPDVRTLAFVSGERAVHVYDMLSGTYTKLASGFMGASSRLALSLDGSQLAVAREDSEINEGVVDLWSVSQGQIVQKLYHPWQVSGLHFAGSQLLVALTDSTIQIWEP